MPDGKPNILVIWGDDIGITQPQLLQPRRSWATRRRTSTGSPDEGMMFTDSYGEQCCTAGRVVVHHRAERVPHRPEQGRDPRRRHRAARRGPDDRRAAQAARLRDRPVRQEPPRRQERVPADRARVRRVLRQPLPPQRRGGAGAPELAVARGVPAVQRDGAAARGHPLLGDRRGRRHRAGQVRPRGQAAHRGHRPADQEADGDHRRRDDRRAARTSSSGPARRRDAVLRAG